MPDRFLEQALRTALKDEGDRLPLTITAAELERRLALRHRGGLSPLASLGVAAAVGLALLGLVAVVGGWFEPRPAIVPVPGPTIVAPSDSLRPGPSGAASLPSLDDLLAPLDPTTIVRAQAFGAADAPPAAISGPAVGVDAVDASTVDFAPAARAGADRLWIACLGPVPLDVDIRAASSAEPRETIAVPCDGAVMNREVDLETGDTIGLRSAHPVSWRFVDETQGRRIPGSSSIPDVVEAPRGDQTLIDATSADGGASAPETDPSTGLATWSIGGLPERGSYRVTLACAGPAPIRYRIGGIEPGPAPSAATVTEVACDGAAHQDRLSLPTPAGTDVAIVGDTRGSWRILVSADSPPIALPPDGGGWAMSTGFGPNYFTDGRSLGVSLVGGDGSVRVVISCAGATTLTGTIEIGVPVPSRPDPFTIDCSSGSSGATLARIYPGGANQVSIVADPIGATTWIAVTTQVRVPSSPAP